MIDSILREMYFYVHNVVGRVEDEFDDCEEFEEYITESIIKNTKENIPNPAIFPPSEINGSIPTVNETVAHLGIAKKGPIVKYKRHVKKTPYFLPI